MIHIDRLADDCWTAEELKEGREYWTDKELEELKAEGLLKD